LYAPHTLRSALKARGRLPVAEAVALGVQLTGALGHIHRHGLVHRDVKPSNVIFVQGQPKLADLGLVTNTSEACSFVGTEGFIPPEGPGTVKADLFALGRLLYEAVTGKDRCEFPELPPDLDAWADREEFLEFNEVVTQLCAPDPVRRYANAAAVAGDLNLILAGRSVRRANSVERRLHRARQISAIALGVLAVAVGVVWFQGMRQHQAEVRAAHDRALRERAETAEWESRQQLYTALLEQARANRLSRELGQRVRTLDAVRRAAAITNRAELRGEAFAALGQPDLRFLRDVPCDLNEGPVFDPTFERYAIARGHRVIEIRSALDRRLLATLPAATNLPAYLMRWSADGRFLAVKRDHPPDATNADLEVWEVASGRRALYVPDGLAQSAMSFHPRQPRFLAGDQRAHLTLWNLETGQTLQEFTVGSIPQMVRFAPDGERFALLRPVADGDEITVCNAQTGTVLSRHAVKASTAIEWHPLGQWLASLEVDGRIRLIDPQSRAMWVLGRHRAQAVSAAFSPDGDYLITGGWEAELICWDLRTRQRAFTIGLNSWTAHFRQDGRQCAIYLRDRVQIYEFQSPDGVRELAGATDQRVGRGALSSQGRWLALGRDDGFAVWDLENPSPPAVVTNGCRKPFFSGAELFASRDRMLTRWQLAPTQPGAAPLLESLPIFTPSGFRTASLRSNELVLCTRTGTCFMSCTNTQPELARYVNQGSGWGGTSPDGRWLAASGRMWPVMRIYQLPEVELAAALTNRSEVWTFAFSPRGHELAVATRAGLEFYDTRSWQRTRELAVASERQSEIIYTPDGSAFWHTSDGRTSALRDARTLEALLPLPTGTLPLALSADGRQLAVSVNTRRVQVWDLARVHEQLRDLGVDWTEP
jgi:WD40 repeat protein